MSFWGRASFLRSLSSSNRLRVRRNFSPLSGILGPMVSQVRRFLSICSSSIRSLHFSKSSCRSSPLPIVAVLVDDFTISSGGASSSSSSFWLELGRSFSQSRSRGLFFALSSSMHGNALTDTLSHSL